MRVFYRLAPHPSFAQVLRRGCGSGGNFGVVVERTVLLAPLARYPGDRWSLEMGGCAHPPLRGYDGDPATGGHTGPPLQAPSCRGRRPRRPASTARVAPAERERQGIRDLPGGFLLSPTRGQGVFQPPKVRRVAVGDCPVFVGTDSEQPPYLSQLARRRKFGA